MFVTPSAQLWLFCSVVQEDSAARARGAVCGLWSVAEGPEVPGPAHLGDLAQT